MKGKNICLFTFQIGKVDHSLKISTHTRKRLTKRNIDEKQVIRNVLSMDLRILKEMKTDNYDVMIIDVENDFTTVIRRNKNKIIIVTAIDKSTEIYIKSDIKTKVIIKN